ncbi:hypothetical protein GV792_16515 [Nocardia cyriacigeorgica]|uniref:hypothetical protein n=1 Tax=Nocardia cyriacigeorgica TaxID=135487 RepID=UPI0013BAA779|nr:hypothetical protein [Nocardia cyriacigeorgica]NEW51645.1 hypothetical protein [Nocardia cyriacigeorgica]
MVTNHDPALKAAVLSDIGERVAGGVKGKDAERQVARQYAIPRQTVSGWRSAELARSRDLARTIDQLEGLTVVLQSHLQSVKDQLGIEG